MATTTAPVYGAIGRPLITETTDEVKSTRATWREWLPPGTPEPDESELLTRAEVLSEAARLGASVTDRELRYWTSLGIVPGPVRQWFRGATRTTYPRWVVLVVYAVRQLRRQGRPLSHIGPLLRNIAFREGPQKFLENFILMEIQETLGEAARHLRLLTGVAYNHMAVTYTRDGDPNTAVTIDADFLM